MQADAPWYVVDALSPIYGMDSTRIIHGCMCGSGGNWGANPIEQSVCEFLVNASAATPTGGCGFVQAAIWRMAAKKFVIAENLNHFGRDVVDAGPFTPQATLIQKEFR